MVGYIQIYNKYIYKYIDKYIQIYRVGGDKISKRERGTKKGEEPIFFEKIGGGNLPKRTLYIYVYICIYVVCVCVCVCVCVWCISF